nr:TAXI family TRAP transporter solute-binding subunit [uncultured Rhodopila sp.]
MTVAAAGLISALLLYPAPQALGQTAARDPARIAQAPNITVGLISGDTGSTDSRIAADIATVLDDADRLRVLPMLGNGSVQNIADLVYLKGVDVAIVHADALAQTMQDNAIPKEGSVQYIAKLYQEEIHVLAGKGIASLNELNGQPINAGRPGSGTELTASTLFGALHIGVSFRHETDTRALELLRRDEIAAMVVIGGKPVPLLQTVPPGTGLHFLPIGLNEQLVDTYLPTSLDYQQYPSLVTMGHSVDTVAVGAVLITLTTAADSLRAKRINRFVDMLFQRFDQFSEPGFHPKWSEVSLFAQVPGWTRYPEAQTLVNKQDQSREANLRSAFGTYLSQTGQSIEGLDPARQQALFQDFLRWRDRRAGP